MRCDKFEVPLSYLYLMGSVVTSWSFTLGVAGLNNPFNCVSVTESTEFSEKTRGNSIGSVDVERDNNSFQEVRKMFPQVAICVVSVHC